MTLSRFARWLAVPAAVWVVFAGCMRTATGPVQPGHPAEAPPGEAAEPQPETEEAPAVRVSLHDLAQGLGLDVAWLERNRRLRLASGATELVFEADRREVLLNGVRVFMGEGAVAGERSLLISRIDRDRLLIPILAPGQLEAKAPVRTIVLDPGHGGRDQGTRNEKLNLLEKEFTIDVAFRTKARLEERGFKVVLTRTTDDYVALPERPALAGRAGAELFVSIHFNATTSPEVRGLESYILTPQFQRSTGSDVLRPDDEVAVPGNVHDAWSAYLGYTLHRTLLADLRLPDRGLKRARFAVLRDLPCPGLLLEGGYLSNPDDAALIASEGYRERLAAAIANGIDVFNQALRRLEAVRAAGPARRET